MKKNKLTIITRPRLYSSGGGMDLSALQGMTGGSSGGGAGFSGLFGAIDSSVQKTLDIAKMFIPKQENPHLVSRRALRGYDLGGALQVANTAASQVAQVVSNINDVNDKAKAIEEDIKGAVTNPTPSSSTEDLLSKWSSWNPTAHISWKDLTNKGSALSYATDMFSMSSQGAAAGSSLGPIGAIAGGVGGLASGFFGNWGAKRRAKKKAGKINKMIDSQNLSTQRAFTNQAEQLDDEMITRDLADFTGWEDAYGGPLHFAFGGNLMTHGADFDTGLTLVGNGGTHEENPNEGVPMGMDSEGIPNLVEEGEVIFNDYVFSKRLKVPKEVRKKYKLRGTKPLTFADAAIQMSKESEERPNDPISQRGLEDGMLKLMVAQEQLRVKKGKTNTFANGGPVRKFAYAGALPTDYGTLMGDLTDMSWMKDIKLPEDDVTQSDWWKEKIKPIGSAPIDPKLTIASAGDQTSYTDKGDIPLTTLENLDGTAPMRKESKRREEKRTKAHMDYLRLAPAASQEIQALKDALGLTNRPDFALGRKIREANRQVRGIGTRAAGQKVGYRPINMWDAINNFNSQMAAQRSAIRNSGNRVGSAGQLLALAYEQNNALGELYAGMEKANWDRLIQSITHNTSVDQADRAAELQGAQADAAQGNIRSQNLITAAKADDAEETAYAQARAINRDKLFNTLGALGKEKIDRSMMKGLIESGAFGTPNQSMLEALNYLGINPKTTTKAKEGGRINRKKKGLTY